ncbi:hypothetical protein AVEN_252935-1 [Araneus ventricosus]|uniref:Uncharacterized protein n=1 Tax=Araneus ventricosus TaxID=182803 RepID=A0A4Y2VHB3_ARAVE|nr:hypothetical protein AVEN_252935-1 [Araneus ventricosus]
MHFLVIVEALCCEPDLQMYEQVKIVMRKVRTVRWMTNSSHPKPSNSSRVQTAAIRTRELLEHLFPHMKTLFLVVMVKSIKKGRSNNFQKHLMPI